MFVCSSLGIPSFFRLARFFFIEVELITVSPSKSLIPAAPFPAHRHPNLDFFLSAIRAPGIFCSRECLPEVTVKQPLTGRDAAATQGSLLEGFRGCIKCRLVIFFSSFSSTFVK